MIIRKIKNKLKPYIHKIHHTKKVLSEMNNQPIILYFGVPMHPNLGDLAQCICIRKFLKENYPEYKIVEIDSKVYMNSKSNLRRKMKPKVKKENLIFFQSGYCTQDLGGIEDLMHQAVINDYPDNKLILLPQTIFFKTEERKKQASKVYDAHKHLLFLARDQVSYNIAKEMFPNLPIKAFPDIVTTMIGNYNFNEEKKNILFCLRNDIEKFYSNEEINRLKDKLKKFETIDEIDTTISEPMNANSKNLEEYIINYIKKLAKYKVVITDRYHGTIFSLIANTPVIVIKTTDHKVTTGVDWFKGIYDDNVFYEDNIENIPKRVEELLNRKTSKRNMPYFKSEYYDKLPEIIEKELK